MSAAGLIIMLRILSVLGFWNTLFERAGGDRIGLPRHEPPRKTKQTNSTNNTLLYTQHTAAETQISLGCWLLEDIAPQPIPRSREAHL